MKPPSARALTLAELSLTHKWTCGVELGVYEAATTDYLLTRCPSLKMIGVDVWQPIEGGPKDKSTGHSPKSADAIAAARVKAEAVRRRHAMRLIYLNMTTQKAARRMLSNDVDFVFVDASHVTADVVADIQAWAPLVRPGGMMLGHDANWPAIQSALKQVGWLDQVAYYDGNVWGRYL